MEAMVAVAVLVVLAVVAVGGLLVRTPLEVLEEVLVGSAIRAKWVGLPQRLLWLAAVVVAT